MGRTECPDLNGLRASLRLESNTFNESEMALFSECTQSCARKVLDTADIVREAWFRQLSFSNSGGPLGKSAVTWLLESP
jgi:hypothetical protein